MRYFVIYQLLHYFYSQLLARSIIRQTFLMAFNFLVPPTFTKDIFYYSDFMIWIINSWFFDVMCRHTSIYIYISFEQLSNYIPINIFIRINNDMCMLYALSWRVFKFVISPDNNFSLGLILKPELICLFNVK